MVFLVLLFNNQVRSSIDFAHGCFYGFLWIFCVQCMECPIVLCVKIVE